MDFARVWNTAFGRIVAILIGIAIIWLGLEMSKPLGYVLEAVGAVVVIVAVININRIGRRQESDL